MENSHFCCEYLYCQMRLDMESTNSKLDFLKENWLDLERPDLISKMSTRNLQCSLCMLKIIIDSLEREEYHCPYRKVIRLVTTQFVVQNTLELQKLQEELQQELAKQEADSPQKLSEEEYSLPTSATSVDSFHLGGTKQTPG